MMPYIGGINAVDVQGTVVVCDTEVLPNDKVFIKGPKVWIGGDMRYLVVDSSGELMLVVRHLHYKEEMENAVMHKTYQFDIYRLDEETELEENGGVRRVRDIRRGDRWCVSPCKRFFTLQRKVHILHRVTWKDTIKENTLGHDLGIYSLNDNSIERFPCCPVWVTPSLGLS